MDKKIIAVELLGIAKELTAGQRVNSKYIDLDGEFPISDVIREMRVITDELERWKRDGAGRISGFGQEWIPQWM